MSTTTKIAKDKDEKPNLQRRKVESESARPLTTNDRLNPIDVELPVTSAPSPGGTGRHTGKAIYVNTEVAVSPGLPTQPPKITKLKALPLSVGVYLVVSGTGAGKTASTAAIVAWANASGVPATYLPVAEPRAGNFATTNLTGDQRFTDYAQFFADLRASLKTTKEVKLLVVDSITTPMKAHSSEFKSQATFPGGMQPSDRAFLDKLSRLAIETNTVILAVINETLIPYVSDLAGAVEGIMRISNVAKITYNDRSAESRRRDVEVAIPTVFVNATLQALGFGEFEPGYGSGRATNTIGI